MNKNLWILLFLGTHLSFAQEEYIYHKKDLKLKGEVKSMVCSYNSPDFNYKYTYFFDKQGKIIEHQKDDRKVRYFYLKNDSISKKIFSDESKSYTITYKYNLENRLIEELYSNREEKKTYSYDKKGNLVKEKRFGKNKNGKLELWNVFEYEYNDNGRVIMMYYSDAIWGITYDSEGRIIERIQYNIHAYPKLKVFMRFSKKYDKKGNLIKESQLELTTTYIYKNNRLLTVFFKGDNFNNEGYMTSVYKYCKKGNLIEIKKEHSKDKKIKTVKYRYDEHQNYIEKKEDDTKYGKSIEKRVFEYY